MLRKYSIWQSSIIITIWRQESMIYWCLVRDDAFFTTSKALTFTYAEHDERAMLLTIRRFIVIKYIAENAIKFNLYFDDAGTIRL